MKHRNTFAGIVVLLVAVALVDAAVYIPPLFRETPVIFESRAAGDARADATLDYRLPNDTRPVSYEVELSTDVHTGEKRFVGSVAVTLIVDVATNAIVLHARQLKILNAKIVKQGSNIAEPILTSYEEAREFLTITADSGNYPFTKDSTWVLTINYEGELRTDNGGFYLSTYLDAEGKTRYLATTQFESTDARHAFPCYDEPAKRALFTITINHDPSYEAISNMPKDDSKSSTGKTTFKQTVSMSSYLLAFIVSDFKSTEGVLNGLPQRIYSRPGTEDQQEWALVSGLLISQRLGEYYGIDFPLPKLDQAAIPDFAAGAMENWGLATYREEYLLYRSDISTTSTQTNIANIIAHEYCHMWFGDLVSVEWWTYLWLKEGFATLFSYQASDDAYPEWGVWQQFHAGDYQSALSNDASQSPRAMTHYVQTPREISTLYDTVSYAKAGSVLGMFQHALGDAVFRRGLNKYLTANQYKSAKEEYLFEALQTAAKELNAPLDATVEAMMSTWTRQGGYPLLTVTRNYNTRAFTVQQRAFFNNQSYTSNNKWYVPFNYIDGVNWDYRDTKATHYISSTKSEITVFANLQKDKCLILNKQSTGYYRINYDLDNWYLIAQCLNEHYHRIHPRNRAQVMHDAHRFMSSGFLDHSVLLSLMTYLPKEDEYAPWSTANSIITNLNFYLNGDNDYQYFKDFVANLTANIYDTLGVNDVPGEQHFRKFIRTIAINLACLSGVESCLAETNNKLKNLIYDQIAIEPNLQSAIFCNGLKETEEKEFNYVFDMLMDSQDQAQRRTLISSLGCAQKKEYVEKFVASSTDSNNKLRDQERSTILSSAYSRGSVGLVASIEFLDKNWEAYHKLTVFGGASPLESDIIAMSKYVVNEEQRTKMNALVAKVKGASGLSSYLEPSVQSNMESNFDWLQTNKAPIFSWIKSTRSSSGRLSVSLVALLTASFMTLVKFL